MGKEIKGPRYDAIASERLETRKMAEDSFEVILSLPGKFSSPVGGCVSSPMSPKGRNWRNLLLKANFYDY